MKRWITMLLLPAMLVSGTFCGAFAESTAAENRSKEQEMTKTEAEYNQLIGNLAEFPVNFVYDDVSYRGFHPAYFTETDRTVTEDGSKKSVVIRLERDDTFAVVLETAFYRDYNAYEYTVHFKNPSSSKNSSVLKYLNAADMTLHGENAVLKGILGDHGNQYLPYEYDLSEQDVNFTSLAGRATHYYFPYFNLETDEGGAMIALGWAGTWQADFIYDASLKSTRFIGTGTVGLQTYLKPGEGVRTPLVALVRYYERDEDTATNAWRRWFIDCNMPKETSQSDKHVQPYISMMLAYDTGLPNSDGSISENSKSWKRSMDAYYDHGLKADFRWFDAGWYLDPYMNTVESDWWGTVGTWEMDNIKWPGSSFLESVEYGHEHGTKTFIWFEPERVTHLDGLAANYGYQREWVLSDHGNNNCYLNNLGDPDCLAWTYDRIIRALKKTGADMYREDFNMDPAIFFSIGDGYQGANRTGITENLYIQGHYSLWDKIIEWCGKNEKCTFIDSCASGGGRNDLESMRRAVPFLRSDSDRTTTSLRLAMTTSLVKWLPYTGAVAKESAGQLSNGVTDLYTLRATMLPHVNYQAAFYHDSETIDWETLRKGQTEWEEASRYFFADFYVLSPYRGVSDTENWTAYEYFDAETSSGLLQAFRPADCQEREYTVCVKGVDENAYYCLRDLDGVNSVVRVKGSALLNGLRLVAETPRTAIMLYIERVE